MKYKDVLPGDLYFSPQHGLTFVVSNVQSDDSDWANELHYEAIVVRAQGANVHALRMSGWVTIELEHRC